jgi:hypothetical protein
MPEDENFVGDKTYVEKKYYAISQDISVSYVIGELYNDIMTLGQTQKLSRVRWMWDCSIRRI